LVKKAFIKSKYIKLAPSVSKSFSPFPKIRNFQEACKCSAWSGQRYPHTKIKEAKITSIQAKTQTKILKILPSVIDKGYRLFPFSQAEISLYNTPAG